MIVGFLPNDIPTEVNPLLRGFQKISPARRLPNRSVGRNQTPTSSITPLSFLKSFIFNLVLVEEHK